MTHEQKKAHALALGASLVWSFSYICIHAAQIQLQALGATSWQSATALFQTRMLGSLFAFLPPLIAHKHFIGTFTKKDWVLILLISFTMTYGYHFPLNLGAQKIPTGLVGLLIGFTPVFSAILARFIFKESLSIQRIGAILMGFLGIFLCLLAQRNLSAETGVDISASGFVLWSALDGACFALVGRALRKDIPVNLKLGLGMLLAVIVGIPLWNIPLWKLLGGLNLWGWLSIFYLAVPANYFAQVSWYRALKTLDAAQVTIYLNVTTVFALLWGVIIFNEKINFLYFIGSTSVVVSLFLFSWMRVKNTES